MSKHPEFDGLRRLSAQERRVRAVIALTESLHNVAILAHRDTMRAMREQSLRAVEETPKAQPDGSPLAGSSFELPAVPLAHSLSALVALLLRADAGDSEALGRGEEDGCGGDYRHAHLVDTARRPAYTAEATISAAVRRLQGAQNGTRNAADEVRDPASPP